jgi:hypothetical protein
MQCQPILLAFYLSKAVPDVIERLHVFERVPWQTLKMPKIKMTGLKLEFLSHPHRQQSRLHVFLVSHQ